METPLEPEGKILEKKSEPKKTLFRFLLTAFLVVGCTLLITLFLPERVLVNGSVDIGLFSLIPAFFLIPDWQPYKNLQSCHTALSEILKIVF